MDNNPAFGLDNGLVPNRRQAIIWTSTDPIHWSIYAALGGDELMHLVKIVQKSGISPENMLSSSVIFGWFSASYYLLLLNFQDT